MGIVGGEEGGMAICPRSCVVRVESRGIVGGPVGHYSGRCYGPGWR